MRRATCSCPDNVPNHRLCSALAPTQAPPSPPAPPKRHHHRQLHPSATATATHHYIIRDEDYVIGKQNLEPSLSYHKGTDIYMQTLWVADIEGMRTCRDFFSCAHTSWPSPVPDICEDQLGVHNMHRRIYANKSLTVHMTQVNKYVRNLKRTSIDDQNMRVHMYTSQRIQRRKARTTAATFSCPWTSGHLSADCKTSERNRRSCCAPPGELSRHPLAPCTLLWT